MTDEECVAFVKEHNIPIPNDYPDIGWAKFIRKTIASVEANPDVRFVYNAKDTLDFANAIKEAVNFYYFNSQVTTASASSVGRTNTLEYSTVYASWDESFKRYNCYAYALNRTSGWYEPGSFSNSSN